MRKAFTLIELMVVLGIIMILVSLLLPIIKSARDQADTIICLSNLRQMGIAAQNYVAVNQGYYPIARDGSAEWDFKVTAAGVEPGILWMGQTTLKIQQCPSYAGKSPTVTDPYTGYNYNTSYIGHGVGEFRIMPAKATQVRRPAEVALFGDGQYYGGTNKYMRAPRKDIPIAKGDSVSVAVRAAGTQGYRHRGKTNVVYCDGHAATVSRRYTMTGPTPTFVGAGTGFLSLDNRGYNLD